MEVSQREGFAVIQPGDEKVQMIREAIDLNKVIELIGGWPVEMVALQGGRVTMYMHGGGKDAGAAMNERATAMLRRDGKPDPAAIHGPVVLGGIAADARKPTPIADEVLIGVLP